MTNQSTTDPYLRALLAEDGQPVSAGARVSHVRAAAEAGRAFYADLSAIPEDRRPSLIAELNELVRRASQQPAA